MTDYGLLATDYQLAEAIGWTVTVIAVTGVILNNHRLRACFVLWLVSNSLSAGLHIHAGMTALAVRDAIFFILAIHGLICWSKKKSTDYTDYKKFTEGKPISRCLKPDPLHTTLAEGKVRRGGIKPPPTHPKPKIRPKPQK